MTNFEARRKALHCTFLAMVCRFKVQLGTRLAESGFRTFARILTIVQPRNEAMVREMSARILGPQFKPQIATIDHDTQRTVMRGDQEQKSVYLNSIPALIASAFMLAWLCVSAHAHPGYGHCHFHGSYYHCHD